MKKILILGHKRSGKDTYAELLCRYNERLSFESSSFFVGSKVVYPVLKDKYDYKNFLQCYTDREAHRAEWYNLISAYNNPKYKLASELLEVHDIYVGLRNKEEYEACLEKDLFDIIFWVDSWHRTRIRESLESFTINYDPTVMFWIDNNHTLQNLEIQAKKFATLL